MMFCRVVSLVIDCGTLGLAKWQGIAGLSGNTEVAVVGAQSVVQSAWGRTPRLSASVLDFEVSDVKPEGSAAGTRSGMYLVTEAEMARSRRGL